MDKQKHFIWAVDPFCDDCSLTKRTARAVRLLAAQWDAEVEPVYLADAIPPNVKTLPLVQRSIREQTARELMGVLRGIHIPGLLPLCMIVAPTRRLRDKADSLIAYAKQKGSQLIAIGTRARKGPSRWIMGSFVESLLLRSDVPLFVINPKEMTQIRLNRILFPTDFSEQSLAAFDQVLSFSKELKAGVTVFHKVAFSYFPAADTAFGAYRSHENMFRREVEAAEDQAQEWAARGQRAGVDTDCRIDCRMIGTASDAILRDSRGNSGMIAMAAHSGPLSSALLGSTTRHVVRSARCPVWVVHTESKKNRPLHFSITDDEVMSDLVMHGRKRA